ncbi:MAG: hypothetical protein KKI08_15210 [Armatimonadetes bacterium]|nr:hypothetical protein [Armatimonadota bacterium]
MILFTALAVWADPPGAFRAPPAPPQQVDLPIITTHRYVDPPGIIVSPISPSVIDACTRATIKFPVTWPPRSDDVRLDCEGLRRYAPSQINPAPERPRLDCEGLRHYGPFEVTPSTPPAPLEAPTLRLRDVMHPR